jgi:hypothetical protein
MMMLEDACIILQRASRRVGGPATVLTMRNLMHATSARQARHMPADQAELAHRIARALPRDGRTTAGFALPPPFEADRYLVDEPNVLLKEHRQVDRSCSFLA